MQARKIYMRKASTSPYFNLETNTEELGAMFNKEDAERIVKCWNNHDDLLQALTDLRKAVALLPAIPSYMDAAWRKACRVESNLKKV